MKLNQKALIINWFTAALWIWALLCAWTDLPIPLFLKPNMALVAFIILVFQVFAHCDIKTIFQFKDKEINFIAVIVFVTIICLILAKSNPGALLTITNLCLLWYLSDKWHWNKAQIVLMGGCFLYLYILWLYNPMIFDDATNPNTTGTITVFTMLVLISCIKYIFPKKKWTILIETLLIALSFYKLLVFHGRGTLIGLLLYCLLRFLSLSPLWSKEYFYKGLCYLLTLGSLFFVFIYTAAWRITGVNFVIPFWNKQLFSGRESIWYEVWNYFRVKPLIGIGSNITIQSWYSYNVHNAIYNILITHGIIVFILVMIYMIKKMFMLYPKYKQYSIFIPAISGIFAIYMESFFDMDLLWFPQFLVWTFMLVILASGQNDNSLDIPKGEP